MDEKRVRVLIWSRKSCCMLSNRCTITDCCSNVCTIIWCCIVSCSMLWIRLSVFLISRVSLRIRFIYTLLNTMKSGMMATVRQANEASMEYRNKNAPASRMHTAIMEGAVSVTAFTTSVTSRSSLLRRSPLWRRFRSFHSLWSKRSK